MPEQRRPEDATPPPSGARQTIDEELLGRAAAINESVADEFAEHSVSPLDNPVLERLAELGVETNAAVSVALQRAHRIAFYMRRARTPRDRDELESEARGLSAEARAQVAALAVAWWDGALTALRARDLERRGDTPKD
jgi:hypothetical protein